MKKNTTKTTVSTPSGFYNNTLTTQGRNGEHKNYPMNFYTQNADKSSSAPLTQHFPGDFYKTHNG